MKRSPTRFLMALGIGVLGLSLTAPGALAQRQNEEPPTLTTDDVLLIPDAASFEMATRRREEAKRKALEASETKAAKGYRRVTTPSGYAFERPEKWQLVENLAATGAPGGFQSDAIFQDPETGAVLTAMSFDRTKAEVPVDISDKAAVDKVIEAMLNPSGDSRSTVKVIRRESGEAPETGVQWVRVKAEGVSAAEGGGTVPATYWLQMTQTKDLLAVVAVAYPSEQTTAALPAYHSVRTLEVLNVGKNAAGATAAGESTAPEKDRSGGLRQ